MSCLYKNSKIKIENGLILLTGTRLHIYSLIWILLLSIIGLSVFLAIVNRESCRWLCHQIVSINRGVPQGTVLWPILLSIMRNNIRPVYPEPNLLLKYADNLTLSVPVSAHQDHSLNWGYRKSIQHWVVRNHIKLNLTETWEVIVHGRISKPLPPLVGYRTEELVIERKSWFKIAWHNFSGESIGLGSSCWQFVTQS